MSVFQTSVTFLNYPGLAAWAMRCRAFSPSVLQSDIPSNLSHQNALLCTVRSFRPTISLQIFRTADLTHSTQKPEQETRVILEELVESGLIEAHGASRGRTYTLSALLYQKAGKKADYIRQTGFDPIQQEQMILSYIKEHRTIKRAEAADLCRIGPHQATRLLQKMAEEGKIILKGSRRGSVYERKA